MKKAWFPLANVHGRIVLLNHKIVNPLGRLHNPAQSGHHETPNESRSSQPDRPSGSRGRRSSGRTPHDRARRSHGPRARGRGRSCSWSSRDGGIGCKGDVVGAGHIGRDGCAFDEDQVGALKQVPIALYTDQRESRRNPSVSQVISHMCLTME